MINFTTRHKISAVSCGDKSISHRALILAALAQEQSVIKNISLCRDVMSTAECLRALGAKITLDGTTAKVCPIVEACDNVLLNCGNSGTTARLLAGVVAGLGVTATFIGDGSLAKRPMQRVLQPLSQLGARYEVGEGFLFKILPSKLRGKQLVATTNSAQVKSAVLLAGLFAEGETSYTENLPTRNHTEILLQQLGADVKCCGKTITVRKSALHGGEICVPNDISSVAFLLGLALLDKYPITFFNVGVNARRMGFVRILKNSGAKITLQNLRRVCGEDVADILVEPSVLKPLFADVGDVCDAIDELPLLVCLALTVQGKHRFSGVSELQYKESNRIAALQKTAEILRQKVSFDGENLLVESDGNLPQKPKFADFGDHRIAMSQAVLCLSVCGGGSLDNGDFSVSFPEFLQAVGVEPLRFALLGSNIQRSLSPKLMRILASKADVCCSYTKVALPPDVSDKELSDTALSFDGANVTMPFKRRVAKLMGAKLPSVNTVGKHILPTSTDGYGIVQSLVSRKIDFVGKQLWIVGAGGAAEACIEQLVKYGCQMQVINRTERHAEELRAKYNLGRCENPVGVLSFVPECDFEKQIVLPQSVRFVLISDYMGKSGLAEQAKQRNLELVSGLEMLYHQGAKSFALWTGTEAQTNSDEFLKEVQDEDTFA